MPQPLVRPIDRLHGNLAISVPTLSQIAAEAAFEGRAELDAIKHGYEDNRKILIEGLPKAGLTRFLPVDGAFYLYADVSEFSDDSFDFARRLLEEAHVAATPGVDFDPINGLIPLRSAFVLTNPPCLEYIHLPGYDLANVMHDARWKNERPRPDQAALIARRAAKQGA